MTAGSPPDRCGTTAGYQAHVDNGTPSCEACKTAQATWQRDYRKRVYLARGPLQIDGTGTRRRVQALNRMGWSCGALGARLGVSGAQVSKWTREAVVYRDTAARIARLYDELWNKPGGSVHAANRSKTKGWMPPLAYDDDTIDDPDATPAALKDTDAVDEVAVQRAMGGVRVKLSDAERAETVRRLTALGLSATEVAARMSITPRSVTRLRKSAA